MAYVVLARKYRPQSFSALVGQEPIVRTLHNAMAMDRVHHAFLFTGARGTGKTTTARLLARALNCAKGPTMQPCGQCPSCKDVARGVSASVIEIDGASNTGVDNIRELREGARYVPAQGRFKIYIVDEVHMLSQAAFNALLKVLEEPPAHVKFIFATTEPHKIPATILSRCQRFDFRRLERATLAKHLAYVVAQEGLALDDASLQTIARQAGGSVRDALSLLDQVLSYAGDELGPDVVRQALGAIDAQLLFDLTESIVDRKPQVMLQLVAEVERSGHDLGQVAQLLLEHLRDVAVAKTGAGLSAMPHRSAEELAELVRQAEARSEGDWQRLFEKACATVQAMRHAAADKVVFEMGLLRLMHVAPAADLSTLLQRVDNLVASLPVGGGTGPGGGAKGPPGGGGAPLEPVTATPEAHPTSAYVTGPTLTRAPELLDVERTCPPTPSAPGRREDVGRPHEASIALVPPGAAARAGVSPHVGSVAQAPLNDGAKAGSAPRSVAGVPPATAERAQAARPHAAAAAAATTRPEAAEDDPAAPPRAPAADSKPSAASAPPTAAERQPPSAGVLPAAAEGQAPHADGGDVSCRFRAFVGMVRRARPSLASVLEHGQLVHFSAQEVVLAFAPQTFWWDAATDEDNRALFERLLKEQLAAKVAWRVVALDHAQPLGPSLAEQRLQQQTSAWEQTKAKAGAHAAVRAAQQILGGTLQQIHPAPGAEA